MKVAQESRQDTKEGREESGKNPGFQKDAKKNPLLEDPDKGQKGGFEKETLEKEELLLRELLVQDKKGLERKGQRRTKIWGDSERKGWYKQERQREREKERSDPGRSAKEEKTPKKKGKERHKRVRKKRR